MDGVNLCEYRLEEIPFKNLKYTQDSVLSTFRDGTSVRNASKKHLEDNILITEYRGWMYILSNRTAVAKQLAGHKSVLCQFRDFEDCKDEFLRKKTGAGGFPRIRESKN